jgi:hypothetical protein
MSQWVVLYAGEDQSEPIGVTEIPSDYPGTPAILIWQQRLFTPAPLGQGGTPWVFDGHVVAEGYVEQTSVLYLPDAAVRTPP